MNGELEHLLSMLHPSRGGENSYRALAKHNSTEPIAGDICSTPSGAAMSPVILFCLLESQRRVQYLTTKQAVVETKITLGLRCPSCGPTYLSRIACLGPPPLSKEGDFLMLTLLRGLRELLANCPRALLPHQISVPMPASTFFF